MLKIFGFKSKQVYPIIYPPLVERINRTAKDKSEVQEASMTPKQLEAQKTSARASLKSELSTGGQNGNAVAGVSTCLKSRFRELELDLDDELQKLFKKTKDENTKLAILKILLALKEGFHPFLESILSRKKPNYETCMKFLCSLSNEEKATFIYKLQIGDNYEISDLWKLLIWRDYGIHNLADALLSIGNENPKLVLENLIKNIQNRNNRFDSTLPRTKLLLSLLDKFEKKSILISFQYLFDIYKNAHDDSFRNTVWKHIKKQLELVPEKKDIVAKVLLNLIYEEVRDWQIDMPKKYFAIQHYAELMGEEGINSLCKLLDSEYSLMIYKVIDILSNGSLGEKGKKALTDAITKKTKEGHRLPLAELTYISGVNPNYEDILLRLFARSDLDMGKIYPTIKDVRLYDLDENGKMARFAPTGNLDFHWAIKELGILKRLVPWMLTHENQTVRLNAARTFHLLEQSQLNGIMDTNLGSKLKEAAAALEKTS